MRTLVAYLLIVLMAGGVLILLLRWRLAKIHPQDRTKYYILPEQGPPADRMG